MPSPLTLPEAPATMADLLPFVPLPADYAGQWGLVFDAALAARLAEVQADNPSQHYAAPRTLADGSYLLRGALLSEVGPNGLYADGFSKLDAARFDEILVIPWADALALLPPDPPMDE